MISRVSVLDIEPIAIRPAVSAVAAAGGGTSVLHQSPVGRGFGRRPLISTGLLLWSYADSSRICNCPITSMQGRGANGICRVRVEAPARIGYHLCPSPRIPATQQR